MSAINHIIISSNAINNGEIYDVISSNISVVNLYLEEGGDMSDLHPDSIASYYVDYYASQYNNGNFSQYG